MRNERQYESIRYTFNADELQELGGALAREEAMLRDLRIRKANVSAELAAQIKATDKRVGDLADKVNAGYEFREVECLAIMEDPRPGQKRIIRIDTNDTIRVEPMTMAEMQGNFGFKEEPGDAS